MQMQIDSGPHPSGQSVSKPDPRHRAQAQHERYLLASILGLSLAIQLLFAPYKGFFNDLQVLLTWGQVFDAHPLMFYSLTGANYPPLTIYMFGVVELLYHGVGHVLGFSNAQLMIPCHNQFAALWFIAKLPLIATNVGASWLIYRLARPVTSARWALLAALGYAVAPSMVLDSAVSGQTDGVPFFPSACDCRYPVAETILGRRATRSRSHGQASACDLHPLSALVCFPHVRTA